MPAERTTMRHVREIVRLKFVGGVPIREIARRVGVAPSTVRTTLERVEAAGLNWPLPEELTDAALEAKLFVDAGSKLGHRRQAEPDWASIHRELKRKHVTLSILWDEYIACDPEGYRYSRFYENIRHAFHQLGQSGRELAAVSGSATATRPSRACASAAMSKTRTSPSSGASPRTDTSSFPCLPRSSCD